MIDIYIYTDVYYIYVDYMVGWGMIDGVQHFQLNQQTSLFGPRFQHPSAGCCQLQPPGIVSAAQAGRLP